MQKILILMNKKFIDYGKYLKLFWSLVNNISIMRQRWEECGDWAFDSQKWVLNMNQASHSVFQDNSRNGQAALCFGQIRRRWVVSMFTAHTHTQKHTAHEHTHLKSQTQTQALTLPSPGEEMKGRHSGKDGCEKWRCVWFPRQPIESLRSVLSGLW